MRWGWVSLRDGRRKGEAKSAESVLSKKLEIEKITQMCRFYIHLAYAFSTCNSVNHSAIKHVESEAVMGMTIRDAVRFEIKNNFEMSDAEALDVEASIFAEEDSSACAYGANINFFELVDETLAEVIETRRRLGPLVEDITTLKVEYDEIITYRTTIHRFSGDSMVINRTTKGEMERAINLYLVDGHDVGPVLEVKSRKVKSLS